MNHHHLIYTPKGLADPREEAFSYAEKYVVCHELGQGGNHFHCYIVTPYAKDKVTDTLKEIQEIPSGQKGKKAVYYSHRFVAEHPADYPDQDLRKFTLGYVQKTQDRIFMKGFTEEELTEALEYYDSIVKENYERTRVIPQTGTFPADGLKEREQHSVQGDWAEYTVYFEKWYKKLDYEASLTDFRKKARAFWFGKSNGLFPVGSHQKRFLQSIYYAYKVHLANGEYKESDADAEILNILT